MQWREACVSMSALNGWTPKTVCFFERNETSRDAGRKATGENSLAWQRQTDAWQGIRQVIKACSQWMGTCRGMQSMATASPLPPPFSQRVLRGSVCVCHAMGMGVSCIKPGPTASTAPFARYASTPSLVMTGQKRKKRGDPAERRPRPAVA
mmetsp:Transcript_28245/g.81381  ORF Transcript_28245/g.81381 Transcript_28245/m.81381 type:complete len:151 (-) Transcript_28245:1780-2232(-)